jgi:hypothetical protein
MTKKVLASLRLSHNYYICTEYSCHGFEKFLRHSLIDIIGKLLRCNAKQTYCTPWMLHSFIQFHWIFAPLIGKVLRDSCIVAVGKAVLHWPKPGTSWLLINDHCYLMVISCEHSDFYGVSMGTKRGTLNHNPIPIVTIGAPKGGGGWSFQAAAPSTNEISKIYWFCKQDITEWYHVIYTSLNQPLKSAGN